MRMMHKGEICSKALLLVLALSMGVILTMLFIDIRENTGYSMVYGEHSDGDWPLPMIVAIHFYDFQETNALDLYDENVQGHPIGKLGFYVSGFNFGVDPEEDLCIERVFVEHLPTTEKIRTAIYEFSQKDFLPEGDSRYLIEDGEVMFSTAPIPVLEFADLCTENGIATDHIFYYSKDDYIYNSMGIRAENRRVDAIPDIMTMNVSDRELYPFDSFATDVYVWVEGKTAKGEPFRVAPDVVGSFDLSETHEIFEVAEIENPDYLLNGKVTEISLQLKRLYSIRILTIVLLLTALVFIIGLYFVKDLGSSLEVAVGLFIGLWGLQSILLPDSIQSVNVVRMAIMYLYVIFALVALLRFIYKPMRQRNDGSRKRLYPENEPVEIGNRTGGEQEREEQNANAYSIEIDDSSEQTTETATISNTDLAPGLDTPPAPSDGDLDTMRSVEVEGAGSSEIPPSTTGKNDSLESD